MSVAALNEARPEGQLAFARSLVIKLIWMIAQIAPGIADRGLIASRGLDLRGEFCDDLD